MSKISININGFEFDYFTKFSISKSIQNVCGEFTFESPITLDNAGDIIDFIKLQDKITINIKDDERNIYHKIMECYVEDIRISNGVDGRTIIASGREKTSDLLKTSAKIKTYIQYNFVSLANQVLKDNNFDNTKIINNVSNLDKIPTPANTSQSGLGVNAGESILQFLNKYAKQLNVLLVTDEDGNLVITRSGSDILNTNILVSPKEKISNVRSSQISISDIERFKTIEYLSQSSIKSYSSSDMNQNGSAVDNNIVRNTKKIIVLDQNADNKTLKNMALWSVNLRIAKGIRYNCTFPDLLGFEGELIKINNLIRITDKICRLDGTFLIQAIEYNVSVNEGASMNLEIVEKGAFDNKPLN